MSAAAWRHGFPQESAAQGPAGLGKMREATLDFFSAVKYHSAACSKDSPFEWLCAAFILAEFLGHVYIFL